MKRYIKSSGWYVGEPTSGVEYGRAMSEAAKRRKQMIADNHFTLVKEKPAGPTRTYRTYERDGSSDGMYITVTFLENAMGPDEMTYLESNDEVIDLYKSHDPKLAWKTLRECDMTDLINDVLPNLDSDKIVWK